MSTRLTQLQEAFQNRMLTGQDDLSPLLSEGAHIGVYDHAYRARLLGILAEDFPALHTLLGDEQFGKVINDFLDDHPSRRRSVRWLGAPLANWLKQTEPWSKLSETADMASFEWALGLAFDATDAEVLDQAGLAATPMDDWPKLSFVFHPALQMITLANDVTSFQQTVARDDEPEAAPERLGKPASWAVWRNHEELHAMFRKLEAEEAAMLEAALKGADFTVLCEILSFGADADDAAGRAAGHILGWVNSGWVSRLSSQAG